jgi:nucleoside-diphosphate-sugar epimerase
VSEATPARTPDNPYGQIKLWQEQHLRRFGKRHGLPYVILRPPNVYGAFSHFTQTLISRTQAGTLAIVDPGDNPCNLVYIDNLVEAILLSLWKSEALGETFFVTDREIVSWSKYLTDHAEWVGVNLPRVSIQELVAPVRQRLVLDSAKVLPQILLSGEMRNLLRKIPIIDLLEGGLYRCFSSLSSETQQKLRVALNGPVRVSENGCAAPIFYRDDPNISSQSRLVAHSSEKARRILGYSAPVSYEEGMALTKAWTTSVGILAPVGSVERF